MDDTLRAYIETDKGSEYLVLILVLMDDTLRVKEEIESTGKIKS